jgi:hypothetical protein
MTERRLLLLVAVFVGFASGCSSSGTGETGGGGGGAGAGGGGTGTGGGGTGVGGGSTATGGGGNNGAVTGAEVATASSSSFTDGGLGYLSQSVMCPAGKVALGGGAVFLGADGGDADGMIMEIVPIGDPPSGWKVAGSTQYQTGGGRGQSDQLQVHVVCAAGASIQVVNASSSAAVNAFVSQSVTCPSGTRAVSGGARFTDADGGEREGMLMQSAATGSPPDGWTAAGSTQYGTSGGPGIGDRIQVFAVCAAGLEPTTAVLASDAGSFVQQSVTCPSGTLAVGGGATFFGTDGGVADGMLMESAPTSSASAGWTAAGSTRFSTANGRGPGDWIQVQAVCVAGTN